MASAPSDLGTQPNAPAIEAVDPPARAGLTQRWFDRSSITADLMVAIEDVSEEDWWEFAPEGQVCEYLDGVVYMPSPATNEHQDETGFWFDLLNGFRYARARDVVVRLGPGVLRLATGRNPEPDVFVVPSVVQPGDPPALLVIEVLSRSTRKHDLVRKRDYFQEAALPEIVYVDMENKQLIVHRLMGGGYSTQTLMTGVWHSAALPGFWVDVSWLWAYDQMDPRECLALILAGPPAEPVP